MGYSDTYKGTGGQTGLFLSGSYGYKDIASLGSTIGFSFGSFGTTFSQSFFAGVGGSFGSGGANVSVGYSVGNGGFDANAGVGVSVGSVSMGVTISSSKGFAPFANSFSTSLTQGSNTKNNNIGNLSSTTTVLKDINIPLLMFGSFSYKKSYTRYWLNVKDNTKNYGSLYGKAAYDDPSFIKNTSSTSDYFQDGPVGLTYDCYSLLSAKDDIQDNPDPDWLVGGSFPAYDDYQVMSQGLSGNMSPIIFDNASLFRKKYNPSCSLSDGTCGDNTNFRTDYPFTDNKVNFRFSNDFSNAVVKKSTTNVDNLATSANLNWIDNFTGTNGVATDNKILYAGSRHIDWYSNNEIVNGTAKSKGFINTEDYTNAYRLKYNNMQWDFFGSCDLYNISDQIGGFSITNESGLTYHYAIPVYNFSSYSYSGKYDYKGKLLWRKDYNYHPYAYTWLLTSITGPDFVDKNNDGIANEGDWGYYVNFRYGKWTDRYGWRIPFEGTIKDIDEKTESFSYGLKELYYLDAVQTRTHTALFIKDIREDGKGVTSGFGGINNEMNLNDPIHNTFDMHVDPNPVLAFTFPFNCPARPDASGSFTGTNPKVSNLSPTSSLRLDRIVLIDNKTLNTPNLNTIRSSSSNLENMSFEIYSCDNCTSLNSTYQNDNTQGTLEYRKIHKGKNIIDVYDNLGSIEANSLKIIKFNYTYELCPETPNSMANPSTMYINSFSQNVSIPQERNGKLTLKSITTLGRGGASILPLTKFEYDYTNPTSGQGSYTNILGVNQLSSSSLGNFSVGDIIKVVETTKTSYLLITSINGSTASIKILGKNSPTTGITLNFSKTKNPPYNKDLYDIWGYYKPDFFNNSLISDNDNRVRTTDISQKNVDVWSLRTITNPTGSEMNIALGSDSYSDVQLQDNYIIPPVFYNNPLNGALPKIENIGGNNFKAYLSSSFINFFQNGYSYTLKSLPEQLMQLATTHQTFQTPVDYLITVQSKTNNNDGTFSLQFTSSTTIPSNMFDYAKTSLSTNVYSRSAYFIAPKPGILYGGDVRTNSVSIKESISNTIFYTNYTYENAQKSFGSIPYEALNIPNIKVEDLPPPFVNGASTSSIFAASNKIQQKQFLKDAYKSLNTLLVLTNELPEPTVLYKQVDVSSQVNNITQNYSRYKFVTFDKSMVKQNISDNEVPPLHKSTTTITNTTSQIGNLKSMEIFDKNDDLIIGSYNNYTSNKMDLAKYNNQGVIHEAFNETRLKRPSTNDYRIKRVLSIRETYPSVLLSTKTITNGQSNSTYNQAFDFYSGQPTEVVNENSKGEKYLSVSKAAYNIYPSMGLKEKNQNNKNMLSQGYSNYTYKAVYNSATKKYEPIGNPLSADIQTWRDNFVYRLLDGTLFDFTWQNQGSTNIWRKDKTYTWRSPINTDGTFSNFTAFDIANQSTYDINLTDGWNKINEVSLYDWNSKILEDKDIKSNYSTTKLGYNDARVLTALNDSKYDEVAVTGLEQDDLTDYGNNVRYFGSEIRCYGSIETTTANIHSGASSLKVGVGKAGIVYKLKLNSFGNYKPRTYKASVWVKGNGNLYYKNYSGSSNTAAPTYYSTPSDVVMTIGSWKLISINIPVTSTDITNNKTIEVGACVISGGNFTYDLNTAGTIYFDDFRFHPISTPMVSYIYNNRNGDITYVLDQENMYTRFVYDNAGKLTQIWKETANGEKQISQQDLHFKLPLAQ